MSNTALCDDSSMNSRSGNKTIEIELPADLHGASRAAAVEFAVAYELAMSDVEDNQVAIFGSRRPSRISNLLIPKASRSPPIPRNPHSCH
jgi:hypothetical protein